MFNKCECGGTKRITFPSLVEAVHPGQYDYCCEKCGKTGIGWSVGRKPTAVILPNKVTVPADDYYDE